MLKTTACPVWFVNGECLTSAFSLLALPLRGQTRGDRGGGGAQSQKNAPGATRATRGVMPFQKADGPSCANISPATFMTRLSAVSPSTRLARWMRVLIVSMLAGRGGVTASAQGVEQRSKGRGGRHARGVGDCARRERRQRGIEARRGRQGENNVQGPRAPEIRPMPAVCQLGSSVVPW